MKNIIALATESEVMSFVGNLWKSEPFRKSFDERGFVYEQSLKFAWLPRMFAESSNDQLERAHFSTWWNIIMLREYDNPIIHDLYYLHEMTHAATMPYIQGIGRRAFDEKMQRNELEASVQSEIAVYFAMPGLRGNSFNHAIYADRFIDDPVMRDLWAVNPLVALETLRSMRRDVMVSKSMAKMDLTEKWIRKFAEQNAVYSSVWADSYGEVEEHLSVFQRMSCLDRGTADEDSSRRFALDRLRGWVEAEAAKDAVDNIPFRQQAELFSPFYWVEKAKYDAAMKAAK